MRERLEAIFFRAGMPWRRVIVSAVLCGAAVGLLMVPKVLQNTSFQQPGISFEFWILAALLIILNCEKPLEAGLKTFVFFLISQPLIYIVQVPFSPYGWALLRYYPRWSLITLLTLPGAALGWYVKKENVLSVLLLSVLNAILALELPSSAASMAESFPRFILSTAFIAFELVFFNLLLFKGRMRSLALGIAAVMLAASAVLTVWNSATAENIFATVVDGGTAPYELVEATDGAKVEVEDDVVRIRLRQKDYRTVEIKLRDAEGKLIDLTFDYSENGASWN